jgi:hypothetical protein
MQKPEEMHFGRDYGCRRESNIRTGNDMKHAAWILFAVVLSFSPASTATPEQCRFIEVRAEREACYQRQDVERAARQKANEARQAEQQKPYEPMTADDAQLAKAMRGICRGC